MRSLREVGKISFMSTPQLDQIIAHAKAGQPEAQFLLSQICAQNGDNDGMLHWLNTACSSGHVEAIGALGRCFESGRGIPSDMAVALEHYDRASLAGSKIAGFHKAQLHHKSRLGDDTQALIRELLIDAAKADFVPALRTIGYLAMQQDASRELALNCLRLAAWHGDPVSSFNLGWYLENGGGDGRTPDEASHWFQRANSAAYPLAAGHPHASTLVPSDLPSPTVAHDIDFNVEFPLYPEQKKAEKQTICSDPPICVFKNVLDATDCAYLMFLSRPFLERAAVINPDGDKSGMVSQVRTNQSTYIPFELVDIISRYAELKIVHETGEDLLCSEPMSVLCYAPGEYYRPHFDFFNPKLKTSQELMQDGGQRTASAVSYLVAPSAGGGTSFPDLKLTVPAESGATLWFRNCFDDGGIDKRSLHAGDTVEAGEKWAITKWFREKPTEYLKL